MTYSEPVYEVLNKYPLDITGIKNESYKDKKGVWWVYTDNDKKILKKVSNSEETLKHILHSVNHLVSNGILIPSVNTTRDGLSYVNFEGSLFVLIDAIEGRNPSYNSPAELDLVVRGLARFHKASKGFTPCPDSKPKYHLGTWVDDYTQQLNDIHGFYRQELTLKNDNAIGSLMIKEFPDIYQRGLAAIEALKGKEYDEWVNYAKKAGSLCHQDFAAGNLIITPSGKLYVLDTDSITIDIPARDIRKLLHKVMKKAGKWDPDLTAKMLKSYQAENPLSFSMWQVVKYDIMFPHLFIGASNKYYYKRDKEWSNEKYLERIKEMLRFEKTINPVLQNFESLIPL